MVLVVHREMHSGMLQATMGGKSRHCIDFSLVGKSCVTGQKLQSNLGSGGIHDMLRTRANKKKVPAAETVCVCFFFFYLIKKKLIY